MAQTLLRAVILRTENPDRAAAFYIALGLPFAKKGDAPVYACTQGDIILEIHVGMSQGARLQLQVPSLEAAISAAGKAGGRLDGRPEPTRMGKKAILLDPAGNRVELVEVYDA